MSDTLAIESVVYNLPDEELYNQLTEHGVSVGPVVGSTRKIYQKKLIKLMGGDVVDSPYSGTVDDEDYSGEEYQNSNGKEYYSETSTSMTYSTKQASPTLRSRAATSEKISDDFSYKGGLSFDEDRHTPSPRPSLRTVTSTKTTSTKYSSPSGNIRESTTLRETFSPSKASDGATEQSPLIRFLVKCVFILILLSLLFFIYQYMYSESPFEGLEKLAKEALNSATKEAKKDPKRQSGT